MEYTRVCKTEHKVGNDKVKDDEIENEMKPQFYGHSHE